MEVDGQRILFTPQEAYWVQNTAARIDPLKVIAKGIHLARIAYAQSVLVTTNVPSNELAQDLKGLPGIMQSLAIQGLHTAIMRHVKDNDLEGQAIIPVTVTAENKKNLLRMATIERNFRRKYMAIAQLERVELEAAMADRQLLNALDNEFHIVKVQNEEYDTQLVTPNDMLEANDMEMQEDITSLEITERLIASLRADGVTI